MKTTLFIDPNSDHKFVVGLRQAFEEFHAQHPHTRLEQFRFRGVAWSETVNGFALSLPRSISRIPLLLQEVPLYLIELEDSVDGGTNSLLEGIYKVDGTRAEVKMHEKTTGHYARRYRSYTIKIEGRDLDAINKLYTAIRQGQARPDTPWDLVVPPAQ